RARAWGRVIRIRPRAPLSLELEVEREPDSKRLAWQMIGQGLGWQAPYRLERRVVEHGVRGGRDHTDGAYPPRGLHQHLELHPSREPPAARGQRILKRFLNSLAKALVIQAVFSWDAASRLSGSPQRHISTGGRPGAGTSPGGRGRAPI